MQILQENKYNPLQDILNLKNELQQSKLQQQQSTTTLIQTKSLNKKRKNNDNKDSNEELEIYKKQTKEKQVFLQYLVSLDKQNQFNELSNIRKTLDTKKQQEYLNCIVKEINNPQKILYPYQKYLLKNCVVIDEAILKQIYLKENNYNEDETKFDFIKNLMQFKFIQCYQLQTKQNQEQYLELKFGDYKNNVIDSKYIIQRFQSFNNTQFQQLAQRIQQMDQVIEFLANLQNQAYDQINEDLFIQNIINKYPNNMLFITQIHQGKNNMLSNIKSYIFNNKWAQANGFKNLEEYQQYLMFNQKVPNSLQFQNLIDQELYFQKLEKVFIDNIFPVTVSDFKLNVLLEQGQIMQNTTVSVFEKVGHNLFFINIIDGKKEKN